MTPLLHAVSATHIEANGAVRSSGTEEDASKHPASGEDELSWRFCFGFCLHLACASKHTFLFLVSPPPLTDKQLRPHTAQHK